MATIKKPKKLKKIKKRGHQAETKTTDFFNVISAKLFSADILNVERLFVGPVEEEKTKEDPSFKFYLLLQQQLITVFNQFKHNQYIGQMFCNRINQANQLIFNHEDGLLFQLKEQLQVTVANSVIKPRIKELEAVMYKAIKYFTRYTLPNALSYLVLGYEFKNELYKFDKDLMNVFSKIWEQYTLAPSKYWLQPEWGLEEVEFFCNLQGFLEVYEGKTGSTDADDNSEGWDPAAIEELFEFNLTSIEEVAVYMTELRSSANKLVSFRAQQLIQQSALFNFWVGYFKEAVLVTQTHFTESCVIYLKEQAMIDDTRATALCNDFLKVVNHYRSFVNPLSTRNVSMRNPLSTRTGRYSTHSLVQVDEASESAHCLLTTSKMLHAYRDEKTIEISDLASLSRSIDPSITDLVSVLNQIIKLNVHGRRRLYPPMSAVISKTVLAACSLVQDEDAVHNYSVIWEVKEKGAHNKKIIDEKQLLCDLLMDTRGWLLIYGPRKSGKTLKLVAACHELAKGTVHSPTAAVGRDVGRDIVYLNMAGAWQTEADCLARVTSQLLLNCNDTKMLTRSDCINALRLFLHSLAAGSVVIFDNFANETEQDFGVDEVYFIDNRVALSQQQSRRSSRASSFASTGAPITPSSLDYFISVYGPVLQEYEYKLCFVLGYSSNNIDKINNLFRTANRSHKCCITSIHMNMFGSVDGDNMSVDSSGNYNSFVSGNVITAYFEIGPLSNDLAESMASLLMPTDPNTLLAASQNVSGKMIELANLFNYKDIRDIGKIVLSFFNMKSKRFQESVSAHDGDLNGTSEPGSGRPVPMLRQKSKAAKSRRRSLTDRSNNSQALNALFPEEIIRGMAVNVLNNLTRNELLCMCCLLSASIKVDSSSPVNGDDETDETSTLDRSADRSSTLDLNIVVDGNVVTKTRSITIPELSHAVERSTSLRSNMQSLDEHSIGSLLHNAFFDAALVWSLCQEPFDQNILHWFIAFNSLLETGLVMYQPGVGYYLPLLYQPIQICLTNNQSEKEKSALQACEVDSKTQVYIYSLHFANEMHRVNCQAYSSTDSALVYFDQNRYHFRHLIIAFMSTSRENEDSDSMKLNDKLTFALCGSLCNILTYRIEPKFAVDLCGLVHKNLLSIISRGAEHTDNIADQFSSPLDVDMRQEKKTRDYLMVLHHTRAWYDGITQYLRQSDGLAKAYAKVDALKDDHENILQLPALERAKLLQLQGYVLERKHSLFAALKCYEEGLSIIRERSEGFKIKNRPNYVIMKNLIDNLKESLEIRVRLLTDALEEGCKCKCCIVS